MELPLSLQSSQCLLSLLVGLGYGMVYAFFKALRLNVRWLTHLTDLLFSLAVLFGNFLLMLYVGRGQFRIFMFFATCIGFFLWFLTLHKLLYPFFVRLWHFFLWPFRILWRFCKNILKKTGKISKKFFSFVKKRVIIKRTKTLLEVDRVAPLQIVTHYQASHISGDDLRNRNNRRHASEDGKAGGRKGRAAKRGQRNAAG
ncbi:MAG: hypothetical protein E7467_07645 [Ruminococcaceae bacterium]|nr:hypothetical protein [Oscillospiraceae bacterium]